ncbi:hypothetical protein BU197_02400 [Streptomyces sp. CBMA291]|nr:hypothetical protein [Streptomyces sp. CBMA291]MBD0713789.1 hypothetical protein [Streptomyces sp. CBMA370]
MVLRAAGAVFAGLVVLAGVTGPAPAVAGTRPSAGSGAYAEGAYAEGVRPGVGGPARTVSPSADRARVVAGGMAAITRRWPGQWGYDDFETTITITRDPGFDGRTYWAHQWDYANDSEGGYVGLQSRSGNDKAVNFSIWGASAWRDLGTGTHCRTFGHEGSGVQCDAAYPWREGVTYRIRIARAGTNGWRASVTDTRADRTTDVATIVLPHDRGGLRSLTEWVENFAQGDDQPDSCADVSPATAVYGRPTANGGTVGTTSSSAYTYGNCASIAKAVCATEQICTLTANQGALPTRKTLRNVYTGYCLDLLSGGTKAGLWNCHENPNQIVSQSATYRLAFPDRAGLCLGAASDDAVTATTCGDSARQQWMPMPLSRAYFNAGTGKCLDPLENGALGAPLRVFTCLGNDFQKWQAGS